MPVIKEMESFAAMSVNSPVDNVYVFDFGQNVAGMAQLRVPGNAYHGRNLTMIHSEQVNKIMAKERSWRRIRCETMETCRRGAIYAACPR